MNPKNRWPVFVLLMFALAALAGCNGADEPATNSTADEHEHDHDHGADGHDHGESGHDHEDAPPASFAEGLKEVEELHAKIKESFAGDDVDSGHGPLHEIGHVLEALPELAGEASLSEEDQQKVKDAVDVLMDSYGAVDERLHADDSVGKSYDEVADEIDEAVASLKAIKMPESQP